MEQIERMRYELLRGQNHFLPALLLLNYLGVINPPLPQVCKYIGLKT